MLFSFLDVSKYGALWLSKFILEVAISYQNILSNLYGIVTLCNKPIGLQQR